MTNETNIKEQLEQSNLAAITLKYCPELRKQRQELENCGDHQPCRRFLEEEFVKQIIIDCRTTAAVSHRTKLGFLQHDPIMTQEQSVITKIMTLFAAEEIILQHNVLDYRIDAYLPRHKLAIQLMNKGIMTEIFTMN